MLLLHSTFFVEHLLPESNDDFVLFDRVGYFILKHVVYHLPDFGADSIRNWLCICTESLNSGSSRSVAFLCKCAHFIVFPKKLPLEEALAVGAVHVIFWVQCLTARLFAWHNDPFSLLYHVNVVGAISLPSYEV